MEYFDVAIIGSGPAGASAALKLAQHGISTVIIEKETLPRHKTCGGGLVFRGRKLLPIDLSTVVEREFHSLNVYFSQINLHYEAQRENPIVSMIVRKDFDKLLVDEAVTKGALLKENTTLKSLHFEQDGIQLQLSNGAIKAKFVLAADGALSQTAKMAGWEKETRKLMPAFEYDIEVSPEDWQRLGNEARFDMDFIPNGYAWSFPKKNHLNIGVVCEKSKVNMREYCAKYIEFLGIKEVISETSYGYQIPVSVRKDGFVKNNVFLVGDAAGFCDALTAEGISNAIYSGVLAAEALIEGELNERKSTELYIQKLDDLIVSELKTSQVVAQLYYGQKTLRNLLLKKNSERFAEYLVDIFMGDKSYPKDLLKSAKSKILSKITAFVK